MWVEQFIKTQDLGSTQYIYIIFHLKIYKDLTEQHFS